MGLKQNIFSDILNSNSEFIPIISDEDETSLMDINVPDVIPVLPLRNTVLFPGVVIPITVGRQKSIQLIKDAYAGDRIIGCLSQIDASIEDPDDKDLFRIGTVAQIVKILEMPDGVTTVIIQGKRRFKLLEMKTLSPYFMGKISLLDELPAVKNDEFDALVSSLKDLSLQIISLSSSIPPEASFAVKNIESPVFLVNFISSNADVSAENKQRLLETNDLKERATLLLEFLSKEVQMLELKKEVQNKVKIEMDQQQREYLLHQQMKTIQEELGSNPSEQEMKELARDAEKKNWNSDVAEIFQKELKKLERTNPAAPDFSILMNYLRTLLDLPWNEVTEDNFDLQNASDVLEEDHFGLEKVKERILEHIAVLKLKGDLKSPILCLHGPPGVGKTSLGKSIARAINRNYVRMSLGGLHDEAEIRGHRKTYIGALPGRIIQNIKKAKSSNPVFILDEIDKVGSDFRGDPSSALLEVLDPEQNSAFHDNYLETDYDLSKVMFIATANNINTINPALKDRMELIDVSGYILEEKIEIAKRHLVPKQLEAHGIKHDQLHLSNKIIELIIDNHTRESGVRELDGRIAKVCRAQAKKIAFKEKYNVKLSVEEINEILGPPTYLKSKYQGNEYAGVVTGLAWTPVGGQILFVETSLSKGKGNLTLTGNLGEVMKESAIIALEYLKSNCDKLDISPDLFNNWNVHVHVPEGAIPKDGPSAGITMITSMASAFTQRKVKNNMAMTGEITLRGKVLPVGGIKEKILAAKRAGIKEIILSEDNMKDITQIKEIYLKGLSFIYVKNIMDVLDNTLLNSKVKNPKSFE